MTRVHYIMGIQWNTTFCFIPIQQSTTNQPTTKQNTINNKQQQQQQQNTINKRNQQKQAVIVMKSQSHIRWPLNFIPMKSWKNCT